MRSLLLSAAVAGAACGPSYVVLEVDVDAPLAIPDEVNRLAVTTSTRADPAEILAEADYPLSPDWSFPIRVLLQPSSETPGWIRHAIVARFGDTPRAAGEVIHDWAAHEDTFVPVELVVIHGSGQ